MRSIQFILLLIITLSPALIAAQNYTLVWEDQFDGTQLDATKWNIEQNEGIWNTGGNRELQHYKKENVSVGDDGNGNNCLIISAKKEAYKGYQFTSGRVNTRGKFAFRRGKLEAMIKIPNLANGLWPAFWTLGYTPVGWPDCGEIDVMEMGHYAAINQNKVNSFIGAHLFWGPHPSDYGKEYIAPYDLSKAFFKHTVVWTENNISVFFNDAATPYFSMGINGANTEEFRDYQHYILLNMAVGGSLPGLFNASNISAGLPASMYVDWVKLYQETPDFAEEELPLFGDFGVYEEEGNTDMHMSPDYDLTISSQGLNTSELDPYRGARALNYQTTANQAFEIKLTSPIKRNFINYANGSLQLHLRTTMQEAISLGIADGDGNEALITLAENESQNVARDGKWHLVYLPLAGLADKADLTSVIDLLIVKGESADNAQLSIDEVIYSQQMPTSGYFGIYTNNPNIANRFITDNVNGHLYNWENTVTFNKQFSAYDGEDVLSFRSSGAAAWWGFGFFSTQALNFKNYAEGTLHLALRTSSSQNFTLAIQGANNTSGEVIFSNNNDPYGFKRDGKWHRVSIPMSTLTAQGLDLSACGNIFTMSGGTIGDLAVDDIYLSQDGSLIENPNRCYPVSISISPENSTIKTGQEIQFTVALKDQFGNETDADISYSASGGSISSEGLFTSNEAGTFTVQASAGDLKASTSIRVGQTSAPATQLAPKPEVHYFNASKTLQIKHSEAIERVVVYNLKGEKITEEAFKNTYAEIDFSAYPASVYLVRVLSQRGLHFVKISTR
ncbi:family 16 glycosylhydrolase [Roseimarinus sediminis]|uniref:family 16 glycosylhydrolase n=1 Tax=Roseimarinus sediminis TaxID=1610899 RepID=UPI003D210E25